MLITNKEKWQSSQWVTKAKYYHYSYQYSFPTNSTNIAFSLSLLLFWQIYFIAKGECIIHCLIHINKHHTNIFAVSCDYMILCPVMTSDELWGISFLTQIPKLSKWENKALFFFFSVVLRLPPSHTEEVSFLVQKSLQLQQHVCIQNLNTNSNPKAASMPLYFTTPSLGPSRFSTCVTKLNNYLTLL